METELKFMYKEGYTQSDIIDEPIIAEHLINNWNMSFAMRSSYLDTSDEILRKRRSVLRIRRANDRYYLTLKMPVHKHLDDESGIYERQEFEFELTGEDYHWDKKQGLNPIWFFNKMNNLTKNTEDDLRQLLHLIEGRALFEMCIADFTRTSYAYAYRTSRFELCFDEGYLGTSEQIEQFSEIEFELLSGKTEDAISLHNTLLQKLPLISAAKSKYGRAIEIADRYR